MKKVFVAGLIGLLPTLLMAQPIARNNKATPGTNVSAATGTDIRTVDDAAGGAKTTKALRKAARQTKQFAKTTKAFNRDFKNSSNVHWSAEKNAYAASFTKDNIRNMVWYSKGGNLIYTLRSYTAGKLPGREKAVIETEYNGYKITWVNEVHQNDIVVYVVNLEDDATVKQVTLCDGVTNVYHAYKKQL